MHFLGLRTVDSGTTSELVSQWSASYYAEMLSLEQGFTPLELAVIGAICEMHLEDRASLEAQLSAAKVRGRENTGPGFYTNFEVERAATIAIVGKNPRPGPQATIQGLKYGMGFILWLPDGYASSLEGYSYEESTVGIDLSNVKFEIIRA